jgi:hypothetical protein
MAEHQWILHFGSQYLVASLWQEYVIRRGRQVIRLVLHKCLTCFKQRDVAFQQLQTARVQPARPFFNCGVDFSGPFYVKQGSPRLIFKWSAMSPLHLPNCQGSASWISQQFKVRCIYCCPSKVYCTKGELFKFVFWQWGDIYWSSIRTSRTQETFCVGITSVKISGTCKFRRIHMAFYSPFGLQEVGVRCMKYHLNGRSHSIYFRRTNQSADSSRNISEFSQANSFV